MNKDEKVTLTIDPGIRFAAYSVFGSSGAILESHTIKFNTKLSQERRLFQLYSDLTEASKRYNIDAVVTEYQFVNIMSNIVGVIMAFAGSIDNVKFDKLTPSSWKKTSFGKGNIDEAILRDEIIKLYPQAVDFDEHQLDCIGIYLAYKKKQEEKTDDVLKVTKRASKSKKLGKN